MYVKTFNFLCAGNKNFVKYQAQGGVLTPTPPLRTSLFFIVLLFYAFALYYILYFCEFFFYVSDSQIK